jgi:hypothetical protein
MNAAVAVARFFTVPTTRRNRSGGPAPTRGMRHMRMIVVRRVNAYEIGRYRRLG